MTKQQRVSLLVVNSTQQPRIDAEGVPRCSLEDCRAYDGKRCRELGYRPSELCEPAVKILAAKYDAMVNAMLVTEGS